MYKLETDLVFLMLDGDLVFPRTAAMFSEQLIQEPRPGLHDSSACMSSTVKPGIRCSQAMHERDFKASTAAQTRVTTREMSDTGALQGQGGRRDLLHLPLPPSGSCVRQERGVQPGEPPWTKHPVPTARPGPPGRIPPRAYVAGPRTPAVPRQHAPAPPSPEATRC